MRLQVVWIEPYCLLKEFGGHAVLAADAGQSAHQLQRRHGTDQLRIVGKALLTHCQILFGLDEIGCRQMPREREAAAFGRVA